ncbi:MAG TPA: rhomboid family intramembrane serine protease [Rectinema sp.]|nr:rhomboid family intramembrane serine protease [Rectinema sp.]
MIPIGDDNTCRRGNAVVNWILIGLNILVFIFIQKFGLDDYVTLALAAIPEEILSGRRLFTLITSQFTHAGFAHLIGNMMFLGIFGDNVECRIGKLRYILLYLISGTIGMLLQILLAALAGGAALQMPLVGASAAISGVLATYLVLFPGNRVVVLLFYFIPTTFSAWFVIVTWFLMQILGGLSGLTAIQNGGTAYFAHIGGFLSAYLWGKSYKKKELKRIAEWRKSRTAGYSDGFHWWIVDDD